MRVEKGPTWNSCPVTKVNKGLKSCSVFHMGRSTLRAFLHVLPIPVQKEENVN